MADAKPIAFRSVGEFRAKQEEQLLALYAKVLQTAEQSDVALDVSACKREFQRAAARSASFREFVQFAWDFFLPSAEDEDEDDSDYQPDESESAAEEAIEAKRAKKDSYVVSAAEGVVADEEAEASDYEPDEEEAVDSEEEEEDE